ncbi:MAG: hypothetical protein DRJ50_09130 [Actinobacteria bacterium]|nr:MAG: hypothetical protein DRJ50_09130 [Actinomycetota bacterium]
MTVTVQTIDPRTQTVYRVLPEGGGGPTTYTELGPVELADDELVVTLVPQAFTVDLPNELTVAIEPTVLDVELADTDLDVTLADDDLDVEVCGP